MTGEASTVTYSIPEPFGHALKSLREALAHRDLVVTGELDLADRIRRHLRIHVDPCLVLYVWPRAGLLRVMAVPCSTALYLPLHVVASGHGQRTEIHLLNLSRLGDGQAVDFASRLQAEVAQAVQTVAMRLSLVG